VHVRGVGLKAREPFHSARVAGGGRRIGTEGQTDAMGQAL